MKTCVLKVICNNCLQDKECVGTGGDGRWLCEDCAKRLEFKNKSDCLIQAGWIATPNVNKKLKFRVKVHASVSRIYEVEAEDEEDARENYNEGDLVDEDEDYEDIDSVRVITD